MRNLLVAQSGGPTAAINATVAGVVSCAVLSGKVDHIYGAVNGIEGVLAEKFLDLGKKLDSAEKISLLMQTPAAALGSCRYKLGDPKENTEDFEEILRIFRRHEIRYFIYIGGNDSMDTVNKLSKYCKENGVEDVFVVGAPKTIDNDLVGTDHCPGFGSAAKYLAATGFITNTDITVYISCFIFGFAMSGVTIAWSLSSIFYAPKSEVSNYQAVHITLTGVRGVFSPALGYAVMKIFEIEYSFYLYAILFLFGGIMMWRESKKFSNN